MEVKDAKLRDCEESITSSSHGSRRQSDLEPEEHEKTDASIPQDPTIARSTTNVSTRSHRSTISRAASALSDPTVHIRDPGPPPDGGLQAWSQAALGHLVITATWGYISAFGVFQTYYESSLSVSGSAISWIGSVQIFLLFGLSTFTGRALDAGYFRLIFLCGSIFQLLGVFTTSVSHSYWQLFLAQGICTGIGNGLQFCPTIGLVSTYFSSNKALAIALGASGSATGGMVFPAIVRQLLPTIGFGWTVRVLGFVILALNAVSFAFLRTRLPPRRSGALVEWAALKESTFSFFVVGMFFNFWGLYFAFYYIGAFARSHIGLSYQDSIDLLIIMNGVGMVGRLLPAYIADKRLGPLNTLLPVAGACGLLLYCWAAVREKSGLYAFACIYGLFAAGIQSLWPATLASLTTDLSKVGARTGLGFTVVSVATLTGSPLGGGLVSKDHGNYLYAQMWAASTFTLGTALMVAARVCKSGWVWRFKV